MTLSIKSPVLGRLFALLLAISAAGPGGEAQAGGPLALWEPATPTRATPLLRVDLSSGLTDKQRAILGSGFTTFSHIELRRPNQVDPPVAAISCTVRYDLWEENFELIVHRKESTSTAIVKSIADYASKCLNIEFVDQAMAEQVAKGGKLEAVLQVEQISAQQAKKIKEWLVDQQSTVMQGLFSHMLGELTLTKTSQFTISIPPKNLKG